MGSTDFIVTAIAPTAAQAYAAAVAEADYAYGHDGYTGEINVKAGFIEMPRPEGFTVDELRRAFLYAVDEEPYREVVFTRDIVVAITEIHTAMLGPDVDTSAALADLNAQSSVLYNQGSRGVITESGPWRVGEDKGRPDYLVTANDTALRLKAAGFDFDAYRAIYNDKWGPALAIHTGENVWTFMGMASC